MVLANVVDPAGPLMGVAAAGCSPFGLFLTFAVIWIIIQYWWVLLIALGVVASDRSTDPVCKSHGTSGHAAATETGPGARTQAPCQ